MRQTVTIKKEVERETEKAVLVNGIWLPKSQVVINKDSINIPEWLWDKTGYKEIYILDKKEYIRIFDINCEVTEAIYYDDGQFVTSFSKEEDVEQVENFKSIEGIKVTTEGFRPIKTEEVLGKKVAAKKEVAEKRVVVKSDNKKETKINKSLLMKRAWEIARNGQAQFGGKVRSYFAEALKMAWAEFK